MELKWWVERKKRACMDTIMVICPKCGRVGRVRRWRKRFMIVHEKGVCCMGRNKDGFEELVEIYEKVRGKDGGS